MLCEYVIFGVRDYVLYVTDIKKVSRINSLSPLKIHYRYLRNSLSLFRTLIAVKTYLNVVKTHEYYIHSM